MLDIGMQELIVIFIVALIVFGPKRLPELGRTIGKSIAELKRAVHGVKEHIDAEMSIMEKNIEDSDAKSEAKDIGAPAITVNEKNPAEDKERAAKANE